MLPAAGRTTISRATNDVTRISGIAKPPESQPIVDDCDTGPSRPGRAPGVARRERRAGEQHAAHTPVQRRALAAAEPPHYRETFMSDAEH
jgi:hypothetical protein